MYSFKSKESEAANKMLDIKNIWADIWFTPRNQISALFYARYLSRSRGVLASGCRQAGGPVFYVRWSFGAAALRTDENEAFWRRDTMQKLFKKSLRKHLDIIKMKWYIVITLKKGWSQCTPNITNLISFFFKTNSKNFTLWRYYFYATTIFLTSIVVL